MEYQRTENDTHFRKISIEKKYVPSFQAFKAGKLNYTNREVLEIMHADGSTEIIQHEIKAEYAYTKLKGKKGFAIPAEVPTEHLWLQDLNGLRYKVPDGIEAEEGRKIMYISGDLDNAELRGDEYFSAAIDLVRHF